MLQLCKSLVRLIKPSPFLDSLLSVGMHGDHTILMFSSDCLAIVLQSEGSSSGSCSVGISLTCLQCKLPSILVGSLEIYCWCGP
jgi:uncharacterized membrane protein